MNNEGMTSYLSTFGASDADIFGILALGETLPGRVRAAIGSRFALLAEDPDLSAHLHNVYAHLSLHSSAWADDALLGTPLLNDSIHIFVSGWLSGLDNGIWSSLLGLRSDEPRHQRVNSHLQQVWWLRDRDQERITTRLKQGGFTEASLRSAAGVVAGTTQATAQPSPLLSFLALKRRADLQLLADDRRAARETHRAAEAFLTKHCPPSARAHFGPIVALARLATEPDRAVALSGYDTLRLESQGTGLGGVVALARLTLRFELATEGGGVLLEGLHIPVRVEDGPTYQSLRAALDRAAEQIDNNHASDARALVSAVAIMSAGAGLTALIGECEELEGRILLQQGEYRLALERLIRSGRPAVTRHLALPPERWTSLIRSLKQSDTEHLASLTRGDISMGTTRRTNFSSLIGLLISRRETPLPDRLGLLQELLRLVAEGPYTFAANANAGKPAAEALLAILEEDAPATVRRAPEALASTLATLLDNDSRERNEHGLRCLLYALQVPEFCDAFGGSLLGGVLTVLERLAPGNYWPTLTPAFHVLSLSATGDWLRRSEDLRRRAQAQAERHYQASDSLRDRRYSDYLRLMSHISPNPGAAITEAMRLALAQLNEAHATNSFDLALELAESMPLLSDPDILALTKGVANAVRWRGARGELPTAFARAPFVIFELAVHTPSRASLDPGLHILAESVRHTLADATALAWHLGPFGRVAPRTISNWIHTTVLLDRRCGVPEVETRARIDSLLAAEPDAGPEIRRGLTAASLFDTNLDNLPADEFYAVVPHAIATDTHLGGEFWERLIHGALRHGPRELDLGLFSQAHHRLPRIRIAPNELSEYRWRLESASIDDSVRDATRLLLDRLVVLR